MRTDLFHFNLPERLIAQRPAPRRDASRLMVLHRRSERIDHRAHFTELLDYLRAGDLLILNNSRVFPARLRGQKAASGGDIEILLLEEIAVNEWWTLLRPGKRVRTGTKLRFVKHPGGPELNAVVLEKNSEGHCRLQFQGTENVTGLLDQLGEIPLPPYITRAVCREDEERYQTVYARASGSVAAPTAGLHFTGDLLRQLREQGIDLCYLTLHVGLGTFAPVKAERVEEHAMHEERFLLEGEVADRINRARAEGRRVIAVGTTTVRVLETIAAANGGRVVGSAGRTRIFIYPPYRFRVVDALITNFHLPQSTLLMLVSAFASPGETRGRDLVLRAYNEAVKNEYRFFSYGDAMFIL